MKYSRVHLEAIGYELAPNVVTSSTLERKLAPVYEKLRLQAGQLEALTGIRERRWWDADYTNAKGALAAAERAFERAELGPQDIEILIYGGVCRDHLEPATACDVASGLALPPGVEVYDISNACLGVLNGIMAVANRIELGQIRAGIVVSCETAREITEIMIERMLDSPDFAMLARSLATLTGGSGAVAVILSDGSFGPGRPRLVGGATRAAPEHHELCRWEIKRTPDDGYVQFMDTDAPNVLRHGVTLGSATWEAFVREVGWNGDDVERVICHQVGSQHRDTILTALGIDLKKDYSTFEYLGNMGTVSLPLTAGLAIDRGEIKAGDRVAFLGIGSGLNCLMLGWEW